MTLTKAAPKASTRKLRLKKDAAAPSPMPAAKGGFPIVGVGASAGGFEAFQDLLKHLPVDTGMGFVLVQHLDPQHESALVPLLQRSTSMPVLQVTQGMVVERNHIYIIPPNVLMEISKGALILTPRGRVRGAARSIDCFFEALAEDQRENAIGVVLSGTATDGTMGLESVKGEGGLTFAQDDTAKYDSMPRSAIAAGCVDFVLSPEAIAKELARIAKHPFVVAAALPLPETGRLASEAERENDQSDPPGKALASGGKGTPRTDSRQALTEAKAEPDKAQLEGYAKILALLHRHCGVDFSFYKSSTIQRRVARRLVLNKHETLADYAAFLKGNTHELDALYSDVLISVTSFFRNPEAFDILKQKVFPKLIGPPKRDGPLRIWVLGCSTGQEAYSLAMTFAEAVTDKPNPPKLQIFATDLNEALLEKARAGLYAKSLAQDIGQERLQRFFTEEEGGYRVNKALREQVVFARQNVMSDPPFSRMDLISCRNLLIYFEPELQKKIFPAFHYALKPDGYLFLGASESIGQFTDLFTAADKKQKIFVRKSAKTPSFHSPQPRERNAQRPGGKRSLEEGPFLPDANGGEFNAQREADRISVSLFAPPGVLINAEGQILQFRGATGAFLEPPTGKASFDLLKMAPEGLMLPLRAAIQTARREHVTVCQENVQMRKNGILRAVNLRVIPLRNLKEPCLLVLFENTEAAGPAGPGQPSQPPTPKGKREAANRITELEQELAETRDYLLSIQEQNESFTDDLQASSEELQSANEELQSINEELETSKEELESTNEELTTINEELVHRDAEQSRLNSDLNNLQASLQTAILLLGRDLSIRRFSPSAEKIFNLVAADLGRNFVGLRHHLNLPGLADMLTDVMESISPREMEVQDREGRWFSLQVRPYLTLDKRIDGVVLVLNDINDLKHQQQQIAAARDYAEAILRTLPVPFLILRADLRVQSASDVFYKVFDVDASESEGRLIYELGNRQWDIPDLRKLLEDILPQKNHFTGYEVNHEFETLGSRTMLLNARQVDSADGTPDRIVLAIEDITDRTQAERSLRHAMAEIEQSSRAKDEFLAALSHELRTPLTPVLMTASALESDTTLSDDLRSQLGMIRRNVELEARLIDDLLDLTRISHGKLQISPVVSDIHDLLEHTAEIVRSDGPGKQVRIRFMLDAKNHHVLADPARLQQVFWNLIKNALKFTPTGGAITVRTQSDKDGSIRISVADTGIGIAKESLTRIFNAFEQIEANGVHQFGGLGLGLAISKAIVMAHGGEIIAESQGEGHGATFSVELATGNAPQIQPVKADPPVGPDHHLRLLVVEDHEATLAVLYRLLTRRGHQVTTATNSRDALTAYAAANFDAVITDLGLPDGSGLDLMREIQRQRPVPGIALSGYGMEEDFHQTKEAGFFAHLVKPVNLDQLRLLLNQLPKGV
ncbi:CheR family methyltransferase [Prosthecobacter sp. SYSU 5D2]|uniref:CheR family methyltransferase n=1 Tax=Prosthecobacter sp. SYSU 5D2 TaxID=3134134 RepID=UPI0031FE9941